MPILEDPKTVPQFIESGQKLMGLDLGTKTIGLAVSDTRIKIATPLETIKRSKFTKDTQALRAFEETHNIGALVIGLPLNMDGSEGSRVQASRAFARNLLLQKDQPIVFWDERLSTSAVTRTLIDADMSRAKRANVVDKMAAAYILQGVLDLLNN
ncbi:MAG: Holliday junction resolvase RuvX [Pseudomonadota bacterium]|nr:Holliday junction resolvase RuvX [Pseudomonadota bacterium]